jgi:DNA-binding NtrC family response regulator
MSILRRIAVISRDIHIHDLAQEVAQEVFVADDLAEAGDIVKTVTPDMALFDGSVSPGHIRRFLDRVHRQSHRVPAAVVVCFDQPPFADREYEQAGISHCLIGHDNHRRLHDIAATIRDAERSTGENEAGDETYFVDDRAAAISMVGRSQAVCDALRMIHLVAESRCNPVLILGETGTGKEVAAKAVHQSRHPNAPFVAVNCAALTSTLLESELFGHVKGAFTSADRDKTGLLEQAGSGPLFRDEIREMPLELQAKLLRVLQERTFRKVGGLKDLTCEATIIASSNRNLKKEVREHRFRQDLYYRLNICPIVLTPLRSPERREDIPLLARYFLAHSNIRGGRPDKVTAITKLALESLSQHDWPGNVRELRNVIERAILLERTDKIGLNSIVIEPSEGDESHPSPIGERVRGFSLEKAERELIARALHETGWQKTQAASLLGITRATLYAKVKQYNIQKMPSQPTDTELPASEPAEAEPILVG